MKDYIKIARLDHWIKNVFIVPGIVAAILLVPAAREEISILKIVLGFFATCLIASANYVINEWLDAEFDQYHPTKKNRPVVGGNVKLKFVLLEYALFALAGIVCSVFINGLFLAMEVGLLVMGIIYNVKPLRTKDIIYLDVITESVNNMIRLLLGWFIITNHVLPPVSILFGYWMAGAFLMGTKRLAEYRMIANPEVAGQYRRSFQYYSEKTLFGSSFFYALCATFFIGVFLIKYRTEYLLAMPVMFVLFAYYIMMAFNEDSAAQKPEKLYKEKKLIAIIVVFVILLAVLSVIDIPMLHLFSAPYLINF
ncbi:MAG: UbiA prenyltransferase family protein [Lachnospiraceae bacterium]|nr:UbiA prenyltransferase family protein [Lachnospiraceae bacterium]